MNQKKRVLSGIQPTGSLHLGNYLGAIANWLPLQKDHQCFFCVVDLHAISAPYDPKMLQDNTRFVAAAYIASGIDPARAHIFVQSHVPAHSELAWILNCHTPIGWLNRMTQFKDKSGKHKEKASLGLYAYPVLQAADILLYHTDFVPVGEDQKQHIELTRDIAIAVNQKCGQDLLTVPEPLVQGPAPRVMSLRDGSSKMSKSDPSDYSRIHLVDDNDTIALKIRKAKTDADPLPASLKDLEGRLEAKNLVTLYAALSDKTPDLVCQELEGLSFSQFKPMLRDALIETLAPIRERTLELLKAPDHLDLILQKGAETANEIATTTLRDVHQALGFLPKM